MRKVTVLNHFSQRATLVATTFTAETLRESHITKESKHEASPNMGQEEEAEAANLSTEAVEPELLPEGGLRGWLCVVGAITGNFCTWGFLTA